MARNPIDFRPTNGTKSNSHELVAETESARDKKPAEASKSDSNEGGISMFWRVFGGTILSIIALSCITVYNHFNNSIAELRRELNAHMESRSELVKKGELEKSTTTLWAGVKEIRVSAQTVENLTERSKSLEQQIERNFKAGADERKDIQVRVDENRKASHEENKELSKKVEELRKTLDEERKEFLRKLEDQRRTLDEERKEMYRKLEDKQKAVADQNKELTGKLQVLAERLASVEGRLNTQALTSTGADAGAKKKKMVDPDDSP